MLCSAALLMLGCGQSDMDRRIEGAYRAVGFPEADVRRCQQAADANFYECEVRLGRIGERPLGEGYDDTDRFRRMCPKVPPSGGRVVISTAPCEGD
jgi:hypothetical protein